MGLAWHGYLTSVSDGDVFLQQRMSDEMSGMNVYDFDLYGTEVLN